MRSLFWDTRIERIDPVRDAEYILARVLEFGRLVDVKWLIRRYGIDRIHDFFRDSGHPELSRRTIGFWRAILRAENETWRSPPEFRRSKAAYWAD